MEENTLITLNDYLKKDLPFRIPYYQRGYIWGKSKGTEKDSVLFLMESIKNYYSQKTDLFLQGVTVSEDKDKIELIDGQQRTTVLYLLLHYLGYNGKFELKYSIRTQSHDFLNSLKERTSDEIFALCDDNKDEEFQDIYFFKKTIRTINDVIKTNNIDHAKLLEYLLSHIKFLYINILKEKAMTVFSMMNGNKAPMEYEEIIKAEMLRLVSQEQDIHGKGQEEQEAEKWEQNLLRSRYAREWDKWLYWWNQPEIIKYYHTDGSIMGLLVKSYFQGKSDRKKSKENFNFENFRDDLLRGENNALEAKNVFAGLRKLQKKFEDVYNSLDDDKKLHNKIGVVLTLFDKDERARFIRDYFVEETKITNIDEYAKLVYLGLTHTEIMEELLGVINTDDAEDKVQLKKDELLSALKNDNLYNEENEYAFRELLRRNVREDTNLGREFDFSIWKERSLEHIYPKSKVYHTDDNGNLYRGDDNPITEQEKKDIKNGDKTWLNRADFADNGSEHCIGNLVLLYKNENSSFGAKEFDDKKSVYFNLMKDRTFRSRHLLHSISVFAKGKWGIEQIQNNKQDFIIETKEYYGI